jgi:hypothetical protein
MQTVLRKTQYVGTFGYNDSADLGEVGFFEYADLNALWQSFELSEALNQAYEQMGNPAYSRILLATDEQGFVIFHLLMISTRFIGIDVQNQALTKAKQWLSEQGVPWQLPENDWVEETIATGGDLPF